MAERWQNLPCPLLSCWQCRKYYRHIARHRHRVLSSQGIPQLCWSNEWLMLVLKRRSTAGPSTFDGDIADKDYLVGCYPHGGHPLLRDRMKGFGGRASSCLAAWIEGQAKWLHLARSRVWLGHMDSSHAGGPRLLQPGCGDPRLNVSPNDVRPDPLEQVHINSTQKKVKAHLLRW